MLINPYRFAAAGDPNFSSVSLLLHGNGANGSTTIIDSSPSPKTMTAVGNAQISTGQSKFGGASIAFDGNGDFATASSSSDWAVTGNYTVEFFARNNAISGPSFGKVILSANRLSTGATTGWGFSHYQGQLGFGVNNTSSGVRGTFDVNNWYHIAAVWNAGAVTLYLDGISLWSSSVADVQATTAGLLVLGGASNLDADRGFNGNIDELRITKGVARYTANFTPPTAPFPDS